MLELNAVSVAFGDVLAVDDVTFTLGSGRVLGVLGPSGSGKSTLLRAIAGLEDLHAGAVSCEGQDMARVPTHRRGFALMFQDGQLFAQQNVAQNVGYSLRLRGVPSARREPRVEELLELVGLAGAGRRSVATLSGGEQQRVALARALAAQPRLLLLDEPLSSLDRELRERLAADVHDILRSTQTTTLMVTHDHDEALSMSDDLGVMMQGRLVQHGPTHQVGRAPVSIAVARFLGFTTVLKGEAAQRVLPGMTTTGQALALRRSALMARPDGGPRRRRAASQGHPVLNATVERISLATDVMHVWVDVPAVGTLAALAPRSTELRVGDPAIIQVDPGAAAVVPDVDQDEPSSSSNAVEGSAQ